MKNKKLIAVISLIILVSTIVWVVFVNNSDNLDKKVLLFKKYIEANDDANALRIFQTLEKDVDKLNRGQSMYVATNAAGIARANKDYELERDIYMRFFEKKFPFYYHLFAAGSYGAQGNSIEQGNELRKAQKYADDDAQKSVINRLLLINNKKVAVDQKTD